MPAAATNPSWRARLRGRLSGMGTRQQLLMLFGLWLLAGTSALLIDGLTSKQIGKRLVISPRTVDVYRARLMRKLGAATTAELVNKLLAG